MDTPNNTFVITAYLIFLPVALLLTFYVARSLFKNSKVFMLEIFRGEESIAMATNRLFEVGFYLVNVGYALLILRINNAYSMDSIQKTIETLSGKIGGFAIYLGVMLFLNLLMFFRGRKKSRQHQQEFRPASKPNPNTAYGV